jgi:NAD(P)-dependent dehydrogenase (short-subunit alcohol dehydrogenase family)
MVDEDANRPLVGRIAVVVGGGRGIGAASATTLASAGARVAVGDLDLDRAKHVVGQIEAAGNEAIALKVDVSDEVQIERLIADTVTRFGGLHVLHNNVAIATREMRQADGPIAELDTAMWDTTMAVNLRGMMLGCKHALPHLVVAGGGSIVNTTSVAGLSGDGSLPAYSVSKAGVVRLTKAVASQYGKHGIRCNAVAPGFVLTPVAYENTTEQQREDFLARHLTPRLGTPQDIAEAVLFLADDRRSGFVTAQVLSVDGGIGA